MFKKKCPVCKKKIGKTNKFCPSCGSKLYKDSEADKKDYGMLGSEDVRRDTSSDDILKNLGFSNLDNLNIDKMMPFFARFPFKKLMQKLTRDIEKEMRELDSEIKKAKTLKEKGNKNIDYSEKFKQTPHGISIQIKFGGPMSPRGFGLRNMKETVEREAEKTGKEKKKKLPKISREMAKKIAKLPRKEADTKIRRFSNKIVYEINMPGVKKIEDVSVNKLENSIEIKAFSKDQVYFKLLPINLPIKNYKLEKGKLILELAS